MYGSHLPNTIIVHTTRILTSKVWYHISLYNEQCKLAIHFAEHNFGPFGHIFFVIASFEPESKTLFRVLFSSLCIQIFVFYYFGIYRIFIFLARPVKRTSKQLFTSLHPRGLEKPEIDYTGQSTPSAMVCTCIRLYMAKHTRGTRVRVKNRYFEKFKIYISTRRIQTKLSTRKRFNTRSILLTLTPTTC